MAKKFAWKNGNLTEVDVGEVTITYDSNGYLTDDSAKNVVQEGVVDNPNLAKAIHALAELREMGFRSFWNENQAAGNVKKINDSWDTVVNRNAREPQVTLLAGLSNNTIVGWSFVVLGVYLGSGDGKWDGVSGFSYTKADGTSVSLGDSMSVNVVDGGDNALCKFRGSDEIAQGHNWQLVIYKETESETEGEEPEREYRTFPVNLFKPEFNGLI